MSISFIIHAELRTANSLIYPFSGCAGARNKAVLEYSIIVLQRLGWIRALQRSTARVRRFLRKLLRMDITAIMSIAHGNHVNRINQRRNLTLTVKLGINSSLFMKAQLSPPMKKAQRHLLPYGCSRSTTEMRSRLSILLKAAIQSLPLKVHFPTGIFTSLRNLIRTQEYNTVS